MLKKFSKQPKTKTIFDYNAFKQQDQTLGSFYKKLLLKYKPLKIDKKVKNQSFLEQIDHTSEFYQLSISHKEDNSFHDHISQVLSVENSYVPNSFKTGRKIHRKTRQHQYIDANRQFLSSSLDKIVIEGFKSKLKPIRIYKESTTKNDTITTLDQSTTFSQISSNSRIVLNQNKKILTKSKYPIKKMAKVTPQKSFRVRKNGQNFHSLDVKRKQSISAWEVQQDF